MKKLKQYRFILGLIIGGFFLYLVLKKADLKEVLGIIKTAKWLYVILGFVSAVAAIVLRSYRWKLLLAEKGKGLRIRNYFDALCVGQMMNGILPFRVGDFVQAYFLGHKSSLSKSMVFSTVVMERLLDCFPPGIILVVGSFFVIMPDQIGIGRILIAMAVLAAGMTLVFRSRKTAENIVERLMPTHDMKDKIHHLIGNFYSGLEVMKKGHVVVRVFMYTVLVWAAYLMIAYSCLLCFDIDIGIMSAMLVMAIAAISVTIPSSPGYVGTWEFFVILALSIFRIDKNRALSFALIYHFVSLAVVALMGLIVVIKTGFSLKQAQEPIEEQQV